MKSTRGKTRRRDAISLSLEDTAQEARKITDDLHAGKLKGKAARRAERKLESLSLHANLLWRIRQKMVELSMP